MSEESSRFLELLVEIKTQLTELNRYQERYYKLFAVFLIASLGVNNPFISYLKDDIFYEQHTQGETGNSTGTLGRF